LKHKSAFVAHFQRLYKGRSGSRSVLDGVQLAVVAGLLVFELGQLVQEGVHRSLSETPLVNDDLFVFIELQVPILTLHSDEVLLSVRPDLGPAPGSDVLFDLHPVVSEDSDGLYEPLVFLVFPAARLQLNGL
jgi:hypothetical protein